jgi:hypothetical protein
MDSLERIQTGFSLRFDLQQYLPLATTSGSNIVQLVDELDGWGLKSPLTLEGWFSQGHLIGMHVWVPPQSTAPIALKQLVQARLKRPYTGTHILLIQRPLYLEEWQGWFEKEVDVWFVCYFGEVWSHYSHAPIIVGNSFPFYRHYPWQLRLECEKVVGILNTEHKA